MIHPWKRHPFRRIPVDERRERTLERRCGRYRRLTFPMDKEQKEDGLVEEAFFLLGYVREHAIEKLLSEL